MNARTPAPNTETLQQLHGVLLVMFDIGVLIMGDSGIGKSELALSLINRGHQLIADDVVNIEYQAPTVIGSCPPPLQDFLEVRGLGILNIRAMYGDAAMCQAHPLQLVINLRKLPNEQLALIDRLNGCRTLTPLFKQQIPTVDIPILLGRPLTILAEAAVRDHCLRMAGYSASDAFIKAQTKLLENHDSH
ncbi:MAG: hypothetical protein Tsb005_06600 [Gammaproteobacteria bacterium]